MIVNMYRSFDKITLAELAELEEWLSAGNDALVQFGSRPPYSSEYLASVDRLCATYGEKLQVVFKWENMDGAFKGTELRQLPHLAALSIVCHKPVAEIRCLWELPELRQLFLGIKGLNDPDVLSGDNLQQLTSLEILQWGTRALDLAPIAGMTQLETLRLAKPVRNFDALTKLSRLKTLSLHLIRPETSLECLAEISALCELNIMSGSRPELSDMRHATLKKLHIQYDRGLTQFDTTPFPRLEEFSMHFQAQVTDLACSSVNAQLKRIVVLHCKKLARFRGLNELPALEHFAIAECPVIGDELRTRN
jgi:hypothetical protein